MALTCLFCLYDLFLQLILSSSGLSFVLSLDGSLGSSLFISNGGPGFYWLSLIEIGSLDHIIHWVQGSFTPMPFGNMNKGSRRMIMRAYRLLVKMVGILLYIHTKRDLKRLLSITYKALIFKKKYSSDSARGERLIKVLVYI